MVTEMREADLTGYLRQSEVSEIEYNGIEANVDGDDEGVDIGEPYETQNIRVSQKMITVFQVEHWIKEGKLDLSPEYQRDLVWDEKRKSALIESLLLRIPIPAFYLDEDDEGDKSVIDGMQRLTTIHSFLNNDFPLKKMQYLSSCEKKYFQELEPKLRARIEDTELAVNILDERCPKMVKFDVFRRVNTGGLPLNYQEIRNIMALPKVRALLKDMAGCREFRSATGDRVKDIRMGAQELCLRYLTILSAYDRESGDLREYSGLLKMMDQMVLILNGMSKKELSNIFQSFQQVMLDCYEILGEYSFCKLDNDKINKSLFTSWAVVLSNACLDRDIVKKNVEGIRAAYKERLTKDVAFYNAITSSTGTRKHILLAIEVIREIMEGVL